MTRTHGSSARTGPPGPPGHRDRRATGTAGPPEPSGPRESLGVTRTTGVTGAAAYRERRVAGATGPLAWARSMGPPGRLSGQLVPVGRAGRSWGPSPWGPFHDQIKKVKIFGLKFSDNQDRNQA